MPRGRYAFTDVVALRGERLQRQGTPAQQLFLVCDGEVHVRLRLRGSTPQGGGGAGGGAGGGGGGAGGAGGAGATAGAASSSCGVGAGAAAVAAAAERAAPHSANVARCGRGALLGELTSADKCSASLVPSCPAHDALGACACAPPSRCSGPLSCLAGGGVGVGVAAARRSRRASGARRPRRRGDTAAGRGAAQRRVARRGRPPQKVA